MRRQGRRVRPLLGCKREPWCRCASYWIGRYYLLLADSPVRLLILLLLVYGLC